jgi:hypothetical protein
MTRFYGLLSAMAFVALLVFSGCGGGTVIDSTKQEEAVQANFENVYKEKVSSVNCPSGVKVEKGTTFKCTITPAKGKEQTETLEIVNGDADVHVINIRGSNE